MCQSWDPSSKLPTPRVFFGGWLCEPVRLPMLPQGTLRNILWVSYLFNLVYVPWNFKTMRLLSLNIWKFQVNIQPVKYILKFVTPQSDQWMWNFPKRLSQFSQVIIVVTLRKNIMMIRWHNSFNPHERPNQVFEDVKFKLFSGKWVPRTHSFRHWLLEPGPSTGLSKFVTAVAFFYRRGVPRMQPMRSSSTCEVFNTLRATMG